MNDMTAVIVPKSDQVNADDFVAGPATYTIQAVAITAGTEQPVSINIGIAGKVYRPCKSMSRVLVAAWGPDAKQYTGRSMTLYRDPYVTWGGLAVGGIRISHLSHIEKDMTMALTATRAQRKPYTVKPLKSAPQTVAGDLNVADAWSADMRARITSAVDRPSLLTYWNSPAAKRERQPIADTDTYREVFAELNAKIDALRNAEGVEP